MDDESIASKLRELERARGKRVAGVARAFYEFKGVIDTDQGPLELHFDDNSTLLLDNDCQESVGVSWKGWSEPFPQPRSKSTERFIATHGQWRHRDQSAEAPYASLVGQTVVRVALLLELGEAAVAEVGFEAASIWYIAGAAETVVWERPFGYELVTRQ